jgi:hypothetical protein
MGEGEGFLLIGRFSATVIVLTPVISIFPDISVGFGHD